MPPTMAPVFLFELLLLEVEDVAAGEPVESGEAVPVVLEPGAGVDPLVSAPGPISGVSRNRRCDAANEKTERRIPTTDGLCFDFIPHGKIFALPCAISTCQKKMVATNCDVGESPLRYTCSIRDRVGKAVGRSLRQCQWVKSLAATENLRPRGQDRCAVVCPLGPANGR